MHFPSDFLFGAATAAYQVEGGLYNNNWARWEDSTRPDGRPAIFTGERCDAASDHWRLFDEDLGRMKELGLRMYRFSVEWSRVEPQRRQFDDKAMGRYRSWCEKLLDAGITPMVTLHHFTEPLWITDKGGFESESTIGAFTDFVRYVAENLYDVVDYWITVNEPVVYALLGWGTGEFPPGKRDPAGLGKVLEHLLRAHGEAYKILHKVASKAGRPCFAAPASNIVGFEPDMRFSPIDAGMTKLLDRAYNRAVLKALETGRLRTYFPRMVDLDVEIDGLAGTWDFAGLNHYFRQLVGARYVIRDRSPVGFDPAAQKNDMGWDLTPGTLYNAIALMAEYGKPIIITENGTCDADVPGIRKERYLMQALSEVSRAIDEGFDVRGYLYWSLIDNFEWAHGFRPRFGLYRVDYETQERMLTRAGERYREVIAAASKAQSEREPNTGVTTR